LEASSNQSQAGFEKKKKKRTFIIIIIIIIIIIKGLFFYFKTSLRLDAGCHQCDWILDAYNANTNTALQLRLGATLVQHQFHPTCSAQLLVAGECGNPLPRPNAGAELVEQTLTAQARTERKERQPCRRRDGIEKQWQAGLLCLCTLRK
jgi:hypothetical protein